MAYGQSNLVLSIRGNSTVEGTDRLRGVGVEHGILLLPQLAASHPQGHVRRHPEPG